MVKRMCLLVMVMVISLSFFGCGGEGSGKKYGDGLDPEHVEFCELLARGAVSWEMFAKYGLEPEVNIEKLTGKETDGDVYPRTTFAASGTYTVKGADGVTYSGTFKVTGYIEGHGSGWDSCEITQPKSGSNVLPELST